MNKKTPFPQWFEIQTDPSFQHQLEETLNEMKLEQDLVALRRC